MDTPDVTPKHSRQETAWIVLDYEWPMYEAMYDLVKTVPLGLVVQHQVRNAIVESLSLHLRNLCNFFTSGPFNLPEHLILDDLAGPFEDGVLSQLRMALIGAYGGHELHHTEGTPAWTLRVMSDCTIYRQRSYDYTAILDALDPPLRALVAEVQKHRGAEKLEIWREERRWREKRRLARLEAALAAPRDEDYADGEPAPAAPAEEEKQQQVQDSEGPL